jgi:phage gpG-like protein
VTIEFDDDNFIPELIKNLDDEHTITVGVFGEKAKKKPKNSVSTAFNMAALASVHEFGKTIKAKKNFLVIPLKKKYKGVDPKTLNLFFLHTKEGHNFLCKNVGKDKIEFCYMLAKSVHIPERSFLRASWDENEEKFLDHLRDDISKAIEERKAIPVVLDELGLEMRGKVQKYILGGKISPKNRPVTLGTRGSNGDPSGKPLVDSGDLIGSIDYEVK